MMRRAVDVKPVDFGDIPNLGLLSADGPASPEYPREGLTTMEHNGTSYCIQAAACTSRQDGGQDVAVCKSCLNHLQNKRVPPESLVCFDAGTLKYLLAILCMYGEYFACSWRVLATHMLATHMLATHILATLHGVC
jgi:hypothetical protein